MENIHILRTDKPSRLTKALHYNNALRLVNKDYQCNANDEVFQHIYITSDEEIKEGDWCIRNGVIEKCNSGMHSFALWGVDAKKIILTDDPDLIKDGVQEINNEFLEWFVKNSACKWVETKVEFTQTHDNLKDGFYYKIIIPQETLKERACTQDVVDEAMKIVSKDVRQPKCVRDRLVKQETLEEAIDKILDENYAYIDDSGDQVYYYTQAKQCIMDFIKWQAERRYSEEEVIELIKKALTHKDYNICGTLVTIQGEIRTGNFDVWFEQFKKK